MLQQTPSQTSYSPFSTLDSGEEQVISEASKAAAGAVEAAGKVTDGHEAGVRGRDGSVQASGYRHLHGAFQDPTHLGHGRAQFRLDARAQQHDLGAQAHFVLVEVALQARVYQLRQLRRRQ